MSNKRSRTDAGWSNASRKAVAINYKIREDYPYATHGRAYLKRGTDAGIARFGETYKLANAEQRKARKAVGYTGRGGYNFWKASKRLRHSGLGKMAFGAATKALTDINPAAGALLASQRDKIVGRGLYSGRGTHNSLIAGGNPSMSVTGGGDNQDMIITHREYLQDVYGPEDSNFHNNKMDINPGLSENFPWLAQLSANFEEYEIQQMVFEFKTTVDPSASGNTNGATGTLIMATNYNPDAPIFTTKEVMMQYHGAQSGRVTDDMSHGVEADPTKNSGSAIKYIRCATPPGNQSLKDFDLGTFQWALVNIPDNFIDQQVGELWVYYTVKVSKPRLFSAVFRNYFNDQWVGQKFNTATYNTTTNPLLLLGTKPLTGTQNGLGLEVLDATAPLYNSTTGAWSTQDLKTTGSITIKFPAFTTGTFRIMYYITEAPSQDGINNPLPALITVGNVSIVKDLYGTNGWTTNASNAYTAPYDVYNVPDANFVKDGFFSGTGSSGNTGTVGNYCICFDVSVVPATAGISNMVSFRLQNVNLTYNSFNPSHSSLNIVPYNPTYNTFVDTNGNIAVPPS